jgi:methane monooxygenase component D
MTIMDLFSNFKSAISPAVPGENDNLTKLYDVEPYTAFSEDLEFMWRWTIYRDQNLVQEGCSLTLDASRRAVDHVLAFFSVATARSSGGA